GEDAVGQQINPGFSDSSWFTVVGVVSNVRHFRLEAEARPEMYFPYLQISDENAAHSMSVVIRATVAPATLANAVRKHVWDWTRISRSRNWRRGEDRWLTARAFLSTMG
ncbi:MAG TPA: hypothetical protein VE715_07600, partial [Blastocatellia bacterium]|nr:hypothetical protein [Blastocatellia bacterium]